MYLYEVAHPQIGIRLLSAMDAPQAARMAGTLLDEFDDVECIAVRPNKSLEWAYYEVEKAVRVSYDSSLRNGPLDSHEWAGFAQTIDPDLNKAKGE